MDQFKSRLPKGAETDKNANDLPHVKCHIVGVRAHGHFTDVYIDSGEYPHDPNLSVTCILRTLLRLKAAGKLGLDLYIQADNTGSHVSTASPSRTCVTFAFLVRENKNVTVLGFLCLLVKKKIFRKVNCSFSFVLVDIAAETNEACPCALRLSSRS